MSLPKLTKRESEVLACVQKGNSNKQIAKNLGMSESTVKMHMGRILKKYGVRTRHQLALYSLEGKPLNLPALEQKPYAWIKHNRDFTGVSFGKQPDETWVAVYLKKGKK